MAATGKSSGTASSAAARAAPFSTLNVRQLHRSVCAVWRIEPADVVSAAVAGDLHPTSGWYGRAGLSGAGSTYLGFDAGRAIFAAGSAVKHMGGWDMAA